METVDTIDGKAGCVDDGLVLIKGRFLYLLNKEREFCCAARGLAVDAVNNAMETTTVVTCKEVNELEKYYCCFGLFCCFQNIPLQRIGSEKIYRNLSQV